jgi:hypothetical protein
MSKELKTEKYNGVSYLCDGKDEAPLKIGSRIIKINSEKGDGHKDGSKGIILGSISTAIEVEGIEEYGYAVVWEGENFPVMVVGSKLRLD